MKIPKHCFFPKIPTKKHWNKLTVDELISLAKQKRSIKNPFKKALVEYIMRIW